MPNCRLTRANRDTLWGSQIFAAAPVRKAANILTAITLTVALWGCSTAIPRSLPIAPETINSEAARRAHETLVHAFPSSYRATERAVITVGSRQFTCDGLLKVSPKEGHHLAIVSALGVALDVRLTTNRIGEVNKVTPLFRDTWARQFVLRDLKWLFTPPESLASAGRRSDGAFVLETPKASDSEFARYVFTPDGGRWQELQLCRKNEVVYQATIRYRSKPDGSPIPWPAEFDVNAGDYRLELQVSELTPLEVLR